MPFCSNALAALAFLGQESSTASSTAETTTRTANQVLHWLSMAAGVLGVVLLIVIALAVNIWRKNKNADPNLDRNR